MKKDQRDFCAAFQTIQNTLINIEVTPILWSLKIPTKHFFNRTMGMDTVSRMIKLKGGKECGLFLVIRHMINVW
jgi:hypothetical protein